MIDHPTADALKDLHARMRGAAGSLRLPLRHRTWKGESGNWQGVGIGSSIDFQDHRPYLPGDDPRYIDWQAYARTGSYTMKLYRDEVSPKVDVLLDASTSMWLDRGKGERALELLYFCIESVLKHGGSLRCTALAGAQVQPLSTPALMAHQAVWPGDADPPAAGPPALDRATLRHGSLRVLLSDLLFPGSPEPMLKQLVRGRGRSMLFVPYTPDEAEPPWEGNVELIDCETEEVRRQRVEPSLLHRYRASYARHFEIWTNFARRYDIPLARVPTSNTFLEALRHHALPVGAVEACS